MDGATVVETDMKERARRSSLTSAQKMALREQRSAVPAELRTAFDVAFNAWKDTWFRGGLALSSDPHTRAVGKESDSLIALGPQILPLVVDKLADADNFLALQLYDAIQPDDRLVVQYGPEDERILEGEQRRALHVVQTWLTNR